MRFILATPAKSTNDSDDTDYSVAKDSDLTKNNKKFRTKKSEDIDVEARGYFKEISKTVFECNYCQQV